MRQREREKREGEKERMREKYRAREPSGHGLPLGDSEHHIGSGSLFKAHFTTFTKRRGVTSAPLPGSARESLNLSA